MIKVLKAAVETLARKVNKVILAIKDSWVKAPRDLRADAPYVVIGFDSTIDTNLERSAE